MHIDNLFFKIIIVFNGPRIILPILSGISLFSVTDQPHFSQSPVVSHELQAVFFSAIQNEMNVIIHQAKGNYLDRMIF